ncbi:hypothetical protein HHUSO_G13666 [Huso huso]|uniref:Uncharacterized protein n=1 Tax=Huso huso TaxID=61971 RepID=A0ABR0ZH13_HUSHU
MLRNMKRAVRIRTGVNQDFTLLFGTETFTKLLEKWDTNFKLKIIKEAKSLTQTADLIDLLSSAEYNSDCWDSDMASLLLPVYLLPPPAGRKKSAKISASGAVDRSCCSLEEHLNRTKGQHQPFLLAVGTTRDKIHNFYIAVDKHLIPCQASSSLGAFDELFKAHFVFSLSYDEALSNVYTFLQTTVYHIDVGSVKESPRVKELRARLLNC